MGHSGKEVYEIAEVVSSVAIEDVFSSTVDIEAVDPAHCRLVWFVDKGPEGSRVRMPVASVIMSLSLAMSAAQRLAKAHALSRADFAGTPIGTG